MDHTAIAVNANCALEGVIPRLNASMRTSQDRDVEPLARGGPRAILRDGGILPATPLPALRAGPEALRHCLTTVLPSKPKY